MACDLEIIREVPLFALLDDEELAVLAEQVDLAEFAPRQRIYQINDPGDRAYVMISGAVQVTTIDEDHQEVVVDEPRRGEFFGFASMLDQTPHQTNAIALEETTCVRVDRNDILALIQKKPHAGMDMLTVLGRQFHAAQQLVRIRATRNPNEMIESEATAGEKIADAVASFGGSWTFIISFLADPRGLHGRQHRAAGVCLGSVSVHPAQFVSLDARRIAGAGDHDEPEPAGHEGSPAGRA